MTRIAQPFTWLEVDPPEAGRVLAERGAAGAELPVVIDGGRVIAAARPDGLADVWGLRGRQPRARYDVVIVGAGPAER